MIKDYFLIITAIPEYANIPGINAKGLFG